MIPLNLHVYYRNATTGGPKQKIAKTKGVSYTALADLNFNLATGKKSGHLVGNTMRSGRLFACQASHCIPQQLIHVD